jgi:HEAT repeat protein
VKIQRLSFLTCFLAIAFSALDAQTISRYAGKETTLEGRWKWAIQQSSQVRDGKDCWIGYRIKRLMDEDSYISSGKSYRGRPERGYSLYALISGDTSERSGSARELRSRGESKIYKRMKDVAFFFHVARKSPGGSGVQKIDECTMELSFDFKNEPLFWLDSAGDDESVRRLEKLFGEATTSILKRQLVEAIGIHQNSDEVFLFLNRLLNGREAGDVRAKAAFWMGELDNPEGLKPLMAIAEKDSSLKVREAAVFAISRFDVDESTDDLISLARTADDPKVRGKAAFWLGQKASRKALATLENIVDDDEETAVQRQALFALSQFKDKEGVERLIDIAKNHRNPRIRKQAIQILGQSDDPRALEALIEIARK